MKFISSLHSTFLVVALLASPVALRAVDTVTLQAPVTITGTFTFTGPETQKAVGNSTTYQAKMITLKFGNVEMLSSLVDDNEIPSIQGWSIVARWTAGDSNIDDYQLYAVKAGVAPVPLDTTDNSVGITTETLAAGYNEIRTNGIPISGSGTIQSGITMSLTDSGDTINLAGVATGSYSIKALIKNGTPAYVPNTIKMTLLGGATLSGTETVVNLTMTIGAPKIVTN